MCEGRVWGREGGVGEERGVRGCGWRERGVCERVGLEEEGVRG